MSKNFEKILQQAVSDNRRVIVPNFGAFIYDATDETVIFSTLLKNNDGFLEEELRKNGTDNPDEVLKKFTTKVINTTERGKCFKIPGLGYFEKTGENLQFTFEKKKPAEILPTQPEPYKEEIHADPKSGIIFAVLFVCLLIFIILSILAYKIFESTDKVDSLILQRRQTEKQFAITDKTMDFADSEEIMPVSKQKYYVIVACFEKQINAERFVFQCKNEGYADVCAILPIGSLFPVSIGVFSSYSEATKCRDKYNRRFNEHTWIYGTK